MRLNIIPITKRKGVAVMLFLSFLFFTMTLILQKAPSPPRRPKTKLIFNNETICTARPSMQVHSRNHLLKWLQPLYATEINQRSIVIVVLSARKNFMKRKLIRQTYGSMKSVNNINILAIVFMLGSLDATGQEKTDSSELEAENIQFGDLIMGEFVDTYRNLTRKTIMAYDWLTSYCQEAQIVVKTDDDVLLNIYKLSEELSNWSLIEIRSSNIWCTVHWNEGVVKDVNSVFYASPQDFPDGVFPTHCAGVGYVTPMTVIDRISKEISTSFLGHVCTHEDVFMTSIVPQKINSNLDSGRPHDPIALFNAPDDWVTYALESETGDEAELLIKLLDQKSNETDELQKKFKPKIFYLLTHNLQFEKRYLKLWQIIENKYKNKTGDK